MSDCVVPGCGNCATNTKRKQVGKGKQHPTTFHKFPNNMEMYKKWIFAINRKNWFPNEKSKVCSDHFREEFFDRSSPFRVTLAINAIPSIFHRSKYKEESDDKSDSEEDDVVFTELDCEMSSSNSAVDVKIEDLDLEEMPLDEINAKKVDRPKESILMKTLKGKSIKKRRTDDEVDSTDPRTYCRICAKLSPISLLSSLYNNAKSLEYLELLDLLLPDLIKVDIRLPTCICKICAGRLENISANINNFKKADNELKIMFNVKYETEKQTKDAIVNLIIEDNPKKGSNNKVNIVNENNLIKSDSYPSLLDEITEINDIEMINFECTHCNKLFPSKTDLVQHSLVVHSVSKFDKISCKMIQTKLSEEPIETVQSDADIPEEIQDEIDDPVDESSNEDEPGDSETTQTYCIICCAIFDTRTALINHTQTFHQIIGKDSFANRAITKNLLSKGVINCTRCPESFCSLKAYRQHVLQHVVLKCDQCGKQFTSAHKLNNHHYNKHILPEPPDEEDVQDCGVVNSDAETTTKKKKKKDGVEVKKKPRRNFSSAKSCLCSICGKLFASSTHLAQHRRVHITARNYLCPKCPKAFKTYTHLAKHQYTHSTEPSFCCQICGKTFRSPGGLHKHAYRHKDTKPYHCEICGRGFLFPAQLAMHRKRHENLRRVDSINCHGNKCRLCGIELNSFNELKSHFYLEHSGFKPYECDECKVTFWTKYQLDVHKRLHSGEKPYECDKCVACFRSSSGLQQHRSVHSMGDFACSTCSKMFKRREHLVLHERTHTGLKMFPCPGCDKVYAQRQTMVKHSQIHDPNFNERANKIANSYKQRAKLIQQIEEDEGAEEQESDEEIVRQSILRIEHGATIDGTPIMEFIRYN